MAAPAPARGPALAARVRAAARGQLPALLWLDNLTRSGPGTLVGAAALVAVEALLLAANLRRRRVLTRGRVARSTVVMTLMTAGWAVGGVIVLLSASHALA